MMAGWGGTVCLIKKDGKDGNLFCYLLRYLCTGMQKVKPSNSHLAFSSPPP